MLDNIFGKLSCPTAEYERGRVAFAMACRQNHWCDW